jgi:hypothetical protein
MHMNRLLPNALVAVALSLAGCSSPAPPSHPEPVKPDPSHLPEAPPGVAKATRAVPEPPEPIPVAPQPVPRPEPEPPPAPAPVRPAKGRPLRPAAPALPAPDGTVVTVATAAQLLSAVAGARPGTTVLLADGRYVLAKPLHIRTDGLTLRGRSGDRAKVALDGAGTLGEAVWLSGCSGVTIADLTVRDVQWNGIKLNSETGVHRLRVYNCEFRNVWQRAVKAVAVPAADRERFRPADCRIEYCLFANDRPKRFGDDPTDTAATFGGDYVAGIDAMYATRWVIRDNVFRGLRGRTGQGRGAVLLWYDARACVVERNVVVDCDAGVSLGNALHDAGAPPHAVGCVVRNNCVTRAPEGALVALHTKDCKLLNNTICDTTGKIARGVRIEFGADGLEVANNLLAGPKIGSDTRSTIAVRNNREGVAADDFADAAAGDLHLARRVDGVTGAADALPDVPRDMDGRRRGRRTDLGAHEFGAEDEPPES